MRSTHTPSRSLIRTEELNDTDTERDAFPGGAGVTRIAPALPLLAVRAITRTDNTVAQKYFK